MGHADAKTTMRYLHHKSQENEAELSVLPVRRPATSLPPTPALPRSRASAAPLHATATERENQRFPLSNVARRDRSTRAERQEPEW
jgi:hypothetical protein